MDVLVKMGLALGLIAFFGFLSMLPLITDCEKQYFEVREDEEDSVREPDSER